MESISELLQIEADAILHKPFILPKHDDIKIYPLTIGQMIEINPYLIALQEKDDSKKITGIISKKDFSEALKIVTEYIPIMTKIIDVIIGKGKAEKLTPDEVLMTLIQEYLKVHYQFEIEWSAFDLLQLRKVAEKMKLKLSEKDSFFCI